MPIPKPKPNKPEEVLEFPVVENFSPEVPVEVLGSIDSKPIKVVAIVDTGSTGFMQIPMAIGMKANLRLLSYGVSIVADGREVKKIRCIGRIRFAGKEMVGIISLSETSDDCLLGMPFLEKLGMDFTVSTATKRARFKSIEDTPEEKTTGNSV